MAEAQGGGPAKEPAEAGDEPADSQVLARQVLVRAVPKSRPGRLDVCSERCWLGLSALIEASSRCGDSRPGQDRIQGQCGSGFPLFLKSARAECSNCYGSSWQGMALQRGRDESWKRRLRQRLQSKAVLLRRANQVWWCPWPFEKQLKVG